ncbi:MAG: 3-oxoacid CoA-transferase subunit A [Gammaproteobacteria bacterium]|nr:3-oxoacid CoA-transferase subunit A [Gammaproteobacteria bacterium]
MINKIAPTLADAVAGIPDGATILVGGFGASGSPHDLLDALAERNPKDLVIVTNNAGVGERGLARLMKLGCVRKLMCSFPRVAGSTVFEELYEAGKLELELIPQGTIAERVRAAGAGIPAFYTRTAVGTPLAEKREHREFNGKTYIMEEAIHGDFALVRAKYGDRWGNLTYSKSTRNFNPVMAMGAKCTIAQVAKVVDLGALDPEAVVTPGIYVDRVVQVGV